MTQQTSTTPPLKSYARILASVQKPIEHFIGTGFWNPSVAGKSGVPDEPDWDTDISEEQTRRACRAVAKELKRPFIVCHPVYRRSEHYKTDKTHSNGAPVWGVRHLPKPVFRYGYVVIPRRKQLAPLAGPLLLLAPNEEAATYSGAKPQAPVRRTGERSVWKFFIYDNEIWSQYYDFVLNDPDCRKARGLDPLPADPSPANPA